MVIPMNDVTWFPAALLAIRGLCHFLIFLRVASFAQGGNNHRQAVGFIAAVFAGFNLAESLRIVMNFQAFVVNVEPYLPGIMVMVLIFVVWSGGNVAKFLPRTIVERLP